LEDLFSAVLSQLKKYHPSGTLKLNNLRIFRSLKLIILAEKILPISLELNFTPNTLGCNELMTTNTRLTHYHPAMPFGKKNKK